MVWVVRRHEIESGLSPDIRTHHLGMKAQSWGVNGMKASSQIHCVPQFMVVVHMGGRQDTYMDGASSMLGRALA